MTDTRRDAALDGLRGWAALAVCVFHFLPETFGRTILPEIRNPIVAAVIDGHLAVVIFFVLSGYVLTAGGWRSDKSGIRRALFRRIPRLLIPILATTAIVYVLLATGLARHDEAFPLAGGRFLNGTVFEPTISSALAFAFFWAFTGMSQTDNYQPFLWTMTYELLGSLIVLFACLAERGGKRVYVFLVAGIVFLLFFLSLGASLLIGALLSLLKKDGLLPDIGRFAIPVVIGGFVLNGFFPDSIWMKTVIAIGFVLAASSPGPVAAFLSTPVSKWLGRLSFPLYLMQWPIMITVFSWLILATPELTVLSVTAIAVISTVAALAAAQLFEPVEILARRPERLLGFLRRPARA